MGMNRMRIRNEYAMTFGILFAFFHSFIAAQFNLGIIIGSYHIHHFYIALILFPILLILHLIKAFNIAFRTIPSWVFWGFWGLILGWLTSEIIFVAQLGFWGYLTLI